MASSWRERLERLGPLRTISRVPCGSPAVLALSVADEPAVADWCAAGWKQCRRPDRSIPGQVEARVFASVSA